MEKAHVLGIPLDNVNEAELKRAIKRLLHRHRGQIVTPNPEFLLEAQRNAEFFNVLQKADLSVPDGIGLKFAAWLRGRNIKRHSGSNLVRKLLGLADAEHLRIAIINWKGGLSNDEEILQAIKSRYPKLACFVQSIERDGTNYNASTLRSFRPDIVFVALGAPWQDIFARRRILHDLPAIRFVMGVGGSFDFLTGKVKRAPRLFQLFGFEWLWRLILQPWRWKRIWNAVVVFSFKVIAWEFRRFCFRYNVMAMIVNQHEEILILNRVGRYNYWGLPQGGVERHEELDAAMKREVFEETGLSDLQVLGKFVNIYSYVWPKYYTRRGYKGQKQSLYILRYNGPRNAIRLDRLEHKGYRWVALDRFVSSVNVVHRAHYKTFLEKYYELR